MATTGLRERKKQQTRRLIADAAAGLFAERGYDAVSVLDVARAADVSEQTVYNYYPSKERLILDRDEEMQERFASAVRARPLGVTPAAALRAELLDVVAAVASQGGDVPRGGMIYLAASSRTVRLHCLAMTARYGVALAEALLDGPMPPAGPVEARVRGTALGGLVQLVFDEIGARVHAGITGATLRSELGAMLDSAVAELDRWS